MKPAIEIKTLSKSFGDFNAIDSISLSVKKGEIVGFLGPNGAGKTTTINLIMGFTKPTSGTINIFGSDIANQGTASRKNIGYLSNDMSLDEGLTGLQELEYLGKLQGTFDKNYVHELEILLGAELNKKIRTLSRGNKQKIGLMSALMHKPDILILDEPTSGLDPLIQAAFNEIILEHKKQGKAAFISSHVLSEVEELCDRYVFINKGKIIADKTIAELRNQTAREVLIRCSDTSKLAKIIQNMEGVSISDINKEYLSFLYSSDINILLQILSSHTISSLNILDTDLERVFMNYYETPGVAK